MTASLHDRATRPLPADMQTGDPLIDRYLEQVNRHLVGSRAIRSHTLAEARDFLLDAGADAEDRPAALEDAMHEFGSPEDIGKAQRRERHAAFLKIALLTGPLFAMLMLALGLLQSGPSGVQWKMLAAMFVFNMLFFGLAMGATFAYAIGVPASPPTQADAGSTVGIFEVGYRTSSRTLCWILIGVFAPLQVALLFALFGANPFGFGAWRWPAILLLLLINTKNIAAPIHALRFRAHVGPDALTVHRFGDRLELHRQQIVAVSRPGWLRQMFSMLYGQQHKITWQAGDSRRRDLTLSLTPDVTHGDRLLAWLEKAAQGNARLPSEMPETLRRG